MSKHILKNWEDTCSCFLTVHSIKTFNVGQSLQELSQMFQILRVWLAWHLKPQRDLIWNLLENQPQFTLSQRVEDPQHCNIKKIWYRMEIEPLSRQVDKSDFILSSRLLFKSVWNINWGDVISAPRQPALICQSFLKKLIVMTFYYHQNYKSQRLLKKITQTTA